MVIKVNNTVLPILRLLRVYFKSSHMRLFLTMCGDGC